MLTLQHQCRLVLQVQDAVRRLRKAVEVTEKLAAPVAGSQLVDAQPVETEAPEEVHLRKRIKLQTGWLYQPSPDGVDENLLILLHGYGDTPGDMST